MAAEPAMVRFFLMGKPHDVPRGLTIQKAMEYAGFRLLRGCGCRGGYLRRLRHGLPHGQRLPTEGRVWPARRWSRIRCIWP